MDKQGNLKLGVIDVLNVLPVYYGILSGRVSLPCDLVLGKVTELNRKLNQGELDISVISSFEYARNAELYYILPDLSVSADGAVRSIYLFLNSPLEQIGGKSIQLTEYSLSSVHLIQTLLKNIDLTFTHKKDRFNVGELLIADEAIRRFYQQKDPYVYDLGELWKEETGLPFAFALWVVRRDIFAENPIYVRETYQALLESKRRSESLIEEMAEQYYAGIFPQLESCAEYLRNLHYDFSSSYQAGFNLFQQKMLELGKLEQVAPLAFLPS